MNLQTADFLLIDFINDYIFQIQKKQSSDCLFCFASRELDPHGIRKVMRSWMSSQDIPVKIAELALQLRRYMTSTAMLKKLEKLCKSGMTT